MGFKYKWITNWEIVYSETFQQQWLNWHNRSVNSSIFTHPVLAMAWIETYRPIRNILPLFCIATEGDTMIFIPLIRWKRNWKNSFQLLIVPLGHSDFDYHDPLIISTNKTQHNDFYFVLLHEIKKTHLFDKIELNGFRNLADQQGWMEESDYCPYCELELFKDRTDFLGSLKTSLRGDLKRQERRMQEKGPITLKSYSGNKILKALDVLPQFLKYHSLRWPNAYKAPGFHQRLVEYGLPLGIVDFTELRMGDTIVSWHLGFRDKQRYYYYMPAINPEFAAYSPGKVHLLYLVEQSIKEGLIIFDHLRGEENYKTGWTNQVQKLYSYTEKSNNLSSRIRNWSAETGKDLIKRL